MLSNATPTESRRFCHYLFDRGCGCEIPETLAYYDKQVLPAIILIPTHKITGLGRGRIRESVEKQSDKIFLN